MKYGEKQFSVPMNLRKFYDMCTVEMLWSWEGRKCPD